MVERKAISNRIRRTREDWIMDSVNLFFSLLILFVTIYPFYYVVVISFNDGIDATRGGIYWFPREFTLSNYLTFFTDIKWVRALGLTAARTMVGATITVLFTTLVAYAMSYKGLIGKKYYMLFFIICMYFSGGVIPYYMVLRTLHLIDTFWVYVIPGGLNLFYITIGRAFFDEIPDSLRESAMLDGASEIKIFTRIIMPISKPFMATLALFSGVGHWNNWYDSTFFVKSKVLRTLPYLMREVINQNSDIVTENINVALQRTDNTTSLSVQTAAMVITVLPIIMIYPFLQKYFVKGMMVGAVKE